MNEKQILLHMLTTLNTIGVILAHGSNLKEEDKQAMMEYFNKSTENVNEALMELLK